MPRKKIAYVDEPPAGLFYIPNFLSDLDEQELFEHIRTEAFAPYNYHGFLAKRQVVFYGAGQGYSDLEVEIKSLPPWLVPLRNRCARLINLAGDELGMALVAHYPIGAGIGWHRDAPQFGPTIVGVSFACDAAMRFRRFVDDREEIFRINLQQGSAYIISGTARSGWQHGMAPVNKLRYSITFRTLKNRALKNSTSKDDPRHSPDSIGEQLTKLQLTNLQLTNLPVAKSQLGCTQESSTVRQLNLFH